MAMNRLGVKYAGALQRGATLHYKVLKNGPVKDLNTGLIWEVKCAGCGLHGDSAYVWSGDGSQETDWDWLDDINAEGGTGYAGHNDWRIPNVRELESIVDYGVDSGPMIDPIFGLTFTVLHWSSTTNQSDSTNAWAVDFNNGSVISGIKSLGLPVRAVRGGPK